MSDGRHIVTAAPRWRRRRRRRWRFCDVTLEIPLLEIRVAPPSRKKLSAGGPIIKKEPSDSGRTSDLPWYATLLVNANTQQRQDEAVILISQTPFREAYMRNADPDAGTSNRPMKAAHGQWQVEMVTGPFPDKKDAEAFCKQWRGCRGIQSRRARGIKLTQEWREKTSGLRCYDKRLAPVHPNRYFQENEMRHLFLDTAQLEHYRDTLAALAKATAEAQNGHTKKTKKKP